MYEPQAYLNGRFLPHANARLPFHDAGFVYGATITDLCRTFRHQLFRLENHLRRFRQSCRLARVAQPVPDEEVGRIAEELVAKNAALIAPEQELALVMFATPGPIGYYAGLPGGAGEGEPTLGMHTFPLPFARYRRLLEKGADLIVPATRHVPGECIDPRIKQRSRLSWWLAGQEVRQTDPSASALLLDQGGHVTESAFANFLIVRGGTVISPPRSVILDGISLRVTEELCRQLGIPFAEAPLTLDDCLRADEAILTGTAFCLAAVRSINGRALPWPGPVAEALRAAWTQAVGLDYRAQLLAPE